jgi:hypothetical protein
MCRRDRLRNTSTSSRIHYSRLFVRDQYLNFSVNSFSRYGLMDQYADSLSYGFLYVSNIMRLQENISGMQ